MLIKVFISRVMPAYLPSNFQLYGVGNKMMYECAYLFCIVCLYTYRWMWMVWLLVKLEVKAKLKNISDFHLRNYHAMSYALFPHRCLTVLFPIFFCFFSSVQSVCHSLAKNHRVSKILEIVGTETNLILVLKDETAKLFYVFVFDAYKWRKPNTAANTFKYVSD